MSFTLEVMATRDEMRDWIRPKDAGHVLYVVTRGAWGMSPGGFTTTLIQAIAKADNSNFLKLAREFRGECWGVKVWQTSEDGVVFLRERFARW